MPTALLQEFIGKICSITMFNDGFGVTAKVVSVEDNWIKVEDKKKQIRLLNGDMIKDIFILPPKYQTY